MFRFLIVAFLFAIAYGGVLPELLQKTNGKIVGGEVIDINEAPYQVAMLYSGNSFDFSPVCGGSIISSTVIVTAAHCVTGYSSNSSLWNVRAGSNLSTTGGQQVDVSRIIVHENFVESTRDYDISLYFLDGEINIDDFNTRPINLASQGSDVPDGAPAIIVGWGVTSVSGSFVSYLQLATSNIANQEDCISLYYTVNQVTDRMVCTGNLVSGGEAACSGDDGGPLVVDGVLVGIFSWSSLCGWPEYPGVWTRVSALRNWIDQQISAL